MYKPSDQVAWTSNGQTRIGVIKLVGAEKVAVKGVYGLETVELSQLRPISRDDTLNSVSKFTNLGDLL